MQLRYDSQAAEREIAIVGSCGFDSLIADLGVETIRQEYEQKNQGIYIDQILLSIKNDAYFFFIDIALIESFLSVKFEQITVCSLENC